MERTILWVENDRRFTEVARHMLADNHVTVVTSVADAGSALAAGVYEIIIVDYDLDDGKGVDVVALINHIEPRPFVVAASSHTRGNDALTAAGANAVCSKLHFHQIMQVLNELAS